MLQILMTSVFLASYSQPAGIQEERNSIKDVMAFMSLHVAAGRCSDISVDSQKALEQAGDVAMVMLPDAESAAQLVNTIGNALVLYSKEDKSGFCADARKTLDSYSPGYLRWYGLSK